MDGMMLLAEAHRAGLKVAAEGDKLVVRGPRHLEPLAARLLAHKPAVMAALRSETRKQRTANKVGVDPCYWCGHLQWWRSTVSPDVIRCGWCHPPAVPRLAEWLEPKEN
ncbi:MAG: hypothetical protein HQ582_08275 [Planctomycetes bacterium]|nr:hypothetical protein [Planctomycetota bacterium]